MRLSFDDIVEITSYLIKRLDKKHFNVRINKYGIITDVSKKGIHCCPSIQNSNSDGKHGYSYICNVTSNNDKSDLGYYFIGQESNMETLKYSENKQTRIDMDTYKELIDAFVDSLNNDYKKIATGASLKEEDEAQDGGLQIQTSDYVYDEKAMLLSEYLDVDIGDIEECQWGKNRYTITEGEHEGEDWLVLTEDEADYEQRESLKSLLYDVGIEQMGVDVEDYIDEQYAEGCMREYFEGEDISEDEIIEILLQDDSISLTDKDLFEPNYDEMEEQGEDFDEDDIDNYTFIGDYSTLQDMYVERQMECYDPIEWFCEYYNIEDELDYYRRHNSDFPFWFDVDRLLDNLMDTVDRGTDLSSYDGTEHYLGKLENGEWVYGYKQ